MVAVDNHLRKLHNYPIVEIALYGVPVIGNGWSKGNARGWIQSTTAECIVDLLIALCGKSDWGAAVIIVVINQFKIKEKVSRDCTGA